MALSVDLKKRLLSAAILLPVVGVIFYLGGIWLIGLIAIIAGLAIFELWSMCKGKLSFFLIASLYVLACCGAFLHLSLDHQTGWENRSWILLLVVLADSGAYIAGRSIGGPKLAPKISPNKTWAGLGGAVVGSLVAGMICSGIFHGSTWPLLMLSAFLGLAEQGGDLLESVFKRYCGVKDSGRLIPGHGGILDRIDGALATSLVLILTEAATGGLKWLWQ